MKRWPAVGVGLAVLWLFVRGVHLPVRYIFGEFLIGLAVGLPIAFVFRRFFLPELALGARLRGVPAAVVYLALFLWELLTANADMAYRVLAPSMPIEPDVIEVPLRVETDLAITTIANSITLTPGTLTMDYDDERNSLYVHAIDGRNPDDVVAPIRTWEDYALRIFDEDRDPGDPVPVVPDRHGSVIEPGGTESDGETDETGEAATPDASEEVATSDAPEDAVTPDATDEGAARNATDEAAARDATEDGDGARPTEPADDSRPRDGGDGDGD